MKSSRVNKDLVDRLVKEALALGRALGLAQGGWVNDALDALEEFPELKKDLISKMNSGAITSKWGLEDPIKKEVLTRFGVTLGD